MKIKNQSLPINYTFEIILGIIVVVILTSIIIMFRSNIVNYFQNNFFHKNSNTQISASVNTESALANYILACYQHATQGLCYVVQYTGSSVSCSSLINKVDSEENIPITGCPNDVNIQQYNLISIYYIEPGIIKLEIQWNLK